MSENGLYADTAVTKRSLAMHAAVFATVGAALIWLGQNMFYTRNEPGILAEQVRATSEQVKSTADTFRAVQDQQTRITVVLGGLQERQSIEAEILREIKDGLNTLSKERRP